MIGRIVRPADFERVLSAPQRSRSAHFAIHHVSGEPQASRPSGLSTGDAPLIPVLSPELSTASAPSLGRLWMNPVHPARSGPSGHWLGWSCPSGMPSAPSPAT
jgi:ribonuclease P protein component